MTDLLPEAVESNDMPPEGISLAELKRIAQLQRGLTALKEELEELGAKAKLAFANAGVTGKQTKVYGKIVVNLGEQNRLDAKEKADLSEAYPFETNPDWYTPVIDTSKVPADITNDFRKTVVTISVKDADAPTNSKPRRARD